MTNLRIIADDLGLAKPINDGIFELLKNGRIHGASLMANGEAFQDAIEKVKLYEVEPRIGIHFVLVEEKSLTGWQMPGNYKEFFWKYIFGQIRKKTIESELRAQIERIIQAGINPQFINSHQHIHLLPGVLNTIIEIAEENNISYARLVDEPIHGKGKFFRKLQLVFIKFLSNLAKKKLNKAGIGYNNKFVGFINAGDLQAEDINFAKSIENGVIELGCHPGYEDDELKKKYSWGNLYHWKKELEMLK